MQKTLTTIKPFPHMAISQITAAEFISLPRKSASTMLYANDKWARSPFKFMHIAFNSKAETKTSQRKNCQKKSFLTIVKHPAEENFIHVKKSELKSNAWGGRETSREEEGDMKCSVSAAILRLIHEKALQLNLNLRKLYRFKLKMFVELNLSY